MKLPDLQYPHDNRKQVAVSRNTIELMSCGEPGLKGFLATLCFNDVFYLTQSGWLRLNAFENPSFPFQVVIRGREVCIVCAPLAGPFRALTE